MDRNWEPWKDPEYAKNCLKEWGNPTDPPRKWSRQKFERLKSLPNLIKGKSVLDVGCGHGHSYAILKPHVDDYLGLDVSPANIEICHSFFPEHLFTVGDIYDLSPWGMYDTTLAIQLFIHLPDLVNPLKELWSHAKVCAIFTVRRPKKREKFSQRKDGLIGHKYSQKQLSDAINDLEGVGRVETFLAPPMRMVYVRITRGEPSKPISPRLFEISQMGII